MLACAAMSSRLSITTRSGWRGVATARTVSCGSSSRDRADAGQHRARARAPVHGTSRARGLAGDPLALAVGERGAAIQADAAIFMRIHGRPRVMRERKPLLSSRASSPSPRFDVDARSRSRAMPLPVHLRIRILASPRPRAPTPAAISASAQGGVRPGGARLERHVGGRAARALAAPRRSAATSACGLAGALVPAFADDAAVACTITQPTRGLGVVVYSAALGELAARAP